MKPVDGNHGRGVMLNLADEAAVRAGYAAARAESRYGGVLVETFLTGNDYRCLVSAASCGLSRSACRPTWRATASTPSPSSSRRPMPTRGAASVTKRS